MMTLRNASLLGVAMLVVLSAARPVDAAGGKPAVLVASPGTGGATSLTLAPVLSFTDDSSSNFRFAART